MNEPHRIIPMGAAFVMLLALLVGSGTTLRTHEPQPVGRVTVRTYEAGPTVLYIDPSAEALPTRVEWPDGAELRLWRAPNGAIRWAFSEVPQVRDGGGR